MSRRVALVVALAIVFAPGWQAGGASDGRDGEALAARVLAPSFDEGLLRDQAADSKEFDGPADDLARLDVADITPALSPPGLRQTRISATIAVVAQATSRLNAGRHGNRAPPLLRPA